MRGIRSAALASDDESEFAAPMGRGGGEVLPPIRSRNLRTDVLMVNGDASPCTGVPDLGPGDFGSGHSDRSMIAEPR